jgi:hypothetical protein
LLADEIKRGNPEDLTLPAALYPELYAEFHRKRIDLDQIDPQRLNWIERPGHV